MSIHESGETTGYERYLDLDEREALSREPLMRRGRAVLATAQLLEMLGIDCTTIGAATDAMRLRLESMPPDTVQAVGHHAALLATLLQPEEDKLVPTQPHANDRRQVEIRDIQSVPVTALDIFAGVLSPADLATYNDLKVHQMQWLFERLRMLIERRTDDDGQTRQPEYLLTILELLMYGSNKKMVSESVGISEHQVGRAMVELRDLLSKNPSAVQIREDVQSASHLTQDSVVILPTTPEVPQPTVNVPAEQRVSRPDKPVPAYGNLQASFRDMLDEAELQALVNLTPSQMAVFLEELEKIIRQCSSKPNFADMHIKRLQQVVGGASYAEIAQGFGKTEGSVYQSAYSLNKILNRAPGEVRRILGLAIAYREESVGESESNIEQPVITVVTTEEVTPPIVETVAIDPKETIIERFQTLFSDDPRHAEVLRGLLDVNRSHANNREIEQEIARLINERIDAQEIDFEALFEERGELVVVRSFIGRFVQAGRTQTVIQRPPRSLHDIAQTIRPAQATAQLFAGLDKLFAAFEPLPTPENTPQNLEAPEELQPLEEFVENAGWIIGSALDLPHEQTLALIHRLRDEEDEVTADMIAANMAILRAAKALNGKLSEHDSRLLVAYLAPRVGQPPLSLGEIARDFSDLFGNDEAALKRKIAELYIEVGGRLQ